MSRKRNLMIEIGLAVGAGAHRVARVLRRILQADDEQADDEPERRRRAMRKSAAARKCPQCGRAAALSDHDVPGDGTVRTCRWCGYARELP